MRRQPKLGPTALIACLLAAAATTASSASQSKYPEERDNDDGGAPSSEAAAADDDTNNEMCSLYLAPSASLDTQGTQHGAPSPLLGVYAGVDLPPHTPLGYTDLVIPIVEIWSHLMHHYGSSTADGTSAAASSAELTARDALDVISTGHHSLDFHMSDLLWEPRHFGGVFTGQGYDSKALAVGLGSLVAGAGGVGGAGGEEGRDMTNVAHGRVRHQRVGVRREDPTAGSFTYYHDLSTYTTKPINAGDELYENFGQHYYADRQGRHRPASLEGGGGAASASASASSDASAASRGGSSNDSRGAHHQGVNIEDIVKKDHKAAGGGFGFMSGLWGVVQDSPIGNVVPKVFQRRADTGDEDEDADDVNEEEESVDAAAEAAPSPNVGGGHHPPEWLSQHGRCLDNIYPAESNIDGAGRGAFATRPIVAGTIIGPAPLVHVPDRSLLDIREPLPPSDEDGMSDAALLSDTVVGKQLLLNYCLGHNTSTMLLCNVGVGTGYINHASLRGGYGSTTLEPNARLQWSDLQNSTWLEMTPEELDGQRTLGLMLEYVATRDIAPGEEILLDYGREWEEAWEDHVAGWNPQPGSERYRDAADLNDELMGSPVLTVGEQRDDPYPATVETSCYYHYVPGTDEQEAEDDGESSSPRIVQRTWMVGMDTEGTNLRSCRILKRIEYENGVEEYTVRVLNNDETHHSALVPDDERLVVTNVPRHAITFTDRMYTTDQHLPNAFRHEAMIPDEIMPENWKNKDV